MKKFFTKQGWLTQYAMACGYIHTSNISGTEWVSFGMNNCELNTYEIKHVNLETGKRIWEVVEGINNARKLYKKIYGNTPQTRVKKSYEPTDMPDIVYA